MKIKKTRYILLLLVFAALQIASAAQDDSKNDGNDLDDVPSQPKLPEHKFKGAKELKKALVKSGKVAKIVNLTIEDFFKNTELNEEHGVGGINIETYYSYNDVVYECPLMTFMKDEDANPFRGHWIRDHYGLKDPNEQQFTAIDIGISVRQAAGINAIKLYNNWMVAKVKSAAAIENAQKEHAARMKQLAEEDKRMDEVYSKWWARIFAAMDRLGKPKRMGQIKTLLTYVGGFVVGIYLAYKIIYELIPRLIGLIFDKLPPIVQEQRLSWCWWGTNRVMWRSRAVKSNIKELHYDDSMKRWLDRSLADDKKRVAANLHRKGQFNFMTLLFKGAPGTGKTVLAKAYAAECGFDFLHIGGSSWSQLTEAKAITHFKKTIKRAADNPAPVLVFIDEIDVAFPKRAKSAGVARKITSTFLEEIAKAYNSNIKFVFATNLREELDPAVRSRCGEEIDVLTPSEISCQKIYNTYINKYSAKHGLKHEKVDMKLQGLTGRDIELICLALAESTKLNGDTLIKEEAIKERFAAKLATAEKKNIGSQKGTDNDSWYLIGGALTLLMVLIAIFIYLRRRRKHQNEL